MTLKLESPLFTPNQSRLFRHLMDNGGLEQFWTVFVVANDRSKINNKEEALKHFIAKALEYEVSARHKVVADFSYSSRAKYFSSFGVVLVMMPGNTFEFQTCGRLPGEVVRHQRSGAKEEGSTRPKGHSFHASLKHQDHRRVRYHD